ncbi:putative uncharacterized protein DDB_G0282133 [Centruroides sculpturatus]|uniref:putative uncharacterized protein DDB_G0282133 n=1 Tax=Centruroides sculpturatus TaxID=218467 RepID=UPI000C6D59C0|nr:putative uncharacterized protein DDB_G0282133 [Centruroides sculpturatus]
MDHCTDDSTYKYFPRSKLQYHQELGTCWFGQVVSGEAQNIVENEIVTKVIVKILKQDATPTDYVHFLQEIRPFRDLNHQNIVKLLGFCLEKDPYLFILEHSIVDLKTYLINHYNEADSLLQDGYILHLACNIADALQHMHDHNFVHMDLAARNCYFTSDFVIKLGDYGTSVQIHKDEYYCRGSIALPLRWCDPDSLTCTASIIETKEINKTANIWTFGVFLWELFEFGKLPYFTLTDEEVLQKVILEHNCLLESPNRSFVHKERIYQIMQMCWRQVSARPTIHEICVLLNYLYDNKNKIPNSAVFEDRWTALQPQITEHNLIVPSTNQVILKFENDFVPSLQNEIDCNSDRDSLTYNSIISDGEKEITKVPSKHQNLQSSIDIFYETDATENVSNDNSDVNFNKCLYSEQNTTDLPELKVVNVPFVSDYSENLQKGQQFEMTECKVTHNTFQASPFDEVKVEKCNLDDREFCNSKSIQKVNHNHNLVNSESPKKSENKDSCFITIEKNDIFTVEIDKNLRNDDTYNKNETQLSTFDDLKVKFDNVSLKSNLNKIENDVCDYLENTVIEDFDCDVQEETNQKSNCENMDTVDICDKKQDIKVNFDNEQDNCKDKLQHDVTLEEKDNLICKKVINEKEVDNNSVISNDETARKLVEESLIFKNDETSPSNKGAALIIENKIVEDIDEATDNEILNNCTCINVLKELSNNSDCILYENSPFDISADINDYNLNDSENFNTENIFNEEEENEPCLDSREIDFDISTKQKIFKNELCEDEADQKHEDVKQLNNSRENSSNNSPEICNANDIDESVILKNNIELCSNLFINTSSSVDLKPFSTETAKLKMETIPERVESCKEESSCDMSSSSEQFIGSMDSIEQENLGKCESFKQNVFEPIVVVKHCSVSSEGDEYNLDDISEALNEINDVNNIEIFNSAMQPEFSDLRDCNKDIIIENSNRPGPSQPLSDHMFATCTNYWNDKVQLINNSDMKLHEENCKSHCHKDVVTLEDLDTVDKKNVISCYDTFQDPFETDEVLRVDTETNVAVLLDSSQSVIGFVPSKIADMSSKQCMIDIQDNEISSPSETPNLPKLANSFCYNGYKTSDISTSSSCSASSDLSVDLDRQSETSSESDMVPEANSMNNSHSYAESIDDVHFSQISSENTSDLLTVNDVNLSFEALENLLTKANNAKEEYNNNNNNLEDSTADFQTSVKQTNLEIKDAQELNNAENEKISPSRDIYTPDFDSDTDDTSSTGTSCTSTSGSFECLYKSERMAAKTSPEIVNDDREDGSETPIQIFSGTWDRKATPTKSSMKSPERKNGQMKKSVSFQEEDPPLFSYPPESEGSDDDSRGYDYPDDFFWNVDYTMYADWDFQTSLDAEEIPEDIIEVEDPEQDDEYLSFRYKALPLCPFQVYSFTDITDDECSESASLKTIPSNEFGTTKNNLIKNNLEMKVIEDPCSSPIGSVPDEVCEEVIETFPHFTDLSDIISTASDDDKNMNACSFEILEVEDNALETTNSKFTEESGLEYDKPSLCLVIEDGTNKNKNNSSSKYAVSSVDDLSENQVQQNTIATDITYNMDANNVINDTNEFEKMEANPFTEADGLSAINEAVNVSCNYNNVTKSIEGDFEANKLEFAINPANNYLKKNNVTNTYEKENEDVPFSNVYLMNEAANDHNLIFEHNNNGEIEDDSIKIEFVKNSQINGDKIENNNLLLDAANGNQNESDNLTKETNVEAFSTLYEDKYKCTDFIPATEYKFDLLSNNNADIFSTQYLESNKVCCNSENKILLQSSDNDGNNFTHSENAENLDFMQFDHNCIHKHNSVGCYDCYKTEEAQLDAEFKDFAFSVFGENEFQTSQQNITEASSSSKSTEDTSEQDSAISSSGEFSPTYSPSLVQDNFKSKDASWDFHQTFLQFSHADNMANDNINAENIDNVFEEKVITESTAAKCTIPIPTIVISDSDNVDNLQDCNDKFERNGNVVLDRNSTSGEFHSENNNAAIWKNV